MKTYRGFESLPHRQIKNKNPRLPSGVFVFKPVLGRTRTHDRVRQNGLPFWTAAGGPQGERSARVNPDRAGSTSPAFFQTQVW
ncbi:hypothetical protein, partial [Dickeya dadantii]|uniref:hypothetical protein n=1 Tax=Dickeya dadantii TaxID=204038 RepID=UPI001C12DA93